MSSLGKRWAKVGPRCAALGLSQRTVRRLGGIDHLEALDPLARQVLINSLTWGDYRKQAANFAAGERAA